MQFVLDRLNDRHASLTILEANTAPGDRPPPQIPRGKRLADRIGYLDLPGVVRANSVTYLTLAHGLIRALDALGVESWVIDLRRNRGGDICTLLAAVGPILGDGIVGGFVDARGKCVPWILRRGRAAVGHRGRFLPATGCQISRPLPAVAVLTSVVTASAAEAVVVAFKGRRATRTFGEPTAGVPTGLEQVRLSDGAWLRASTSLFVDRTGRPYRSSILPDEAVDLGPKLSGAERDPVLATAVAHLAQSAR